MFRLLFHLYILIKRPMTLGVRAVIEDERGAVLLVRHTYVKGWYFPGGGVEPGQTLKQALARELQEEVNIDDMGDAELFGMYLNRHFSKRDHVGVYLCRGWNRHKPFVANSEIAEAEFFSLDELPKEITDGTRRRLEEIYQGVEKSEDW